MRLLPTRLAVASLLAILLASTVPAVHVAASAGITGLSVMGDGFTRTWRSPDTTFFAPVDQDGTAVVSRISLGSNTGYPWGTIWVGAPNGDALAVGTYANATSAVGSAPYLWVNETGCTPETGTFEVLELETSGDTVIRLALRFTIACDRSPSSRSGEYRYNSTIDLPGPDLAPHDATYNTVLFGEVLGGTSSPPVTVTLTNAGSSALTVSDVALTGASPGSFEIVDDACSGIEVAPGASCPVGVRATPPLLGGNDFAYLTFTADTSRTTFGEMLVVKGLTATTLEITTPAAVPADQNVQLKAKVHPGLANTVNGSVTFYIDDVWTGGSGFNADGEAVALGSFHVGDHALRAVYYPDACCVEPGAAPAEATKTITGLKRVDLDLTSGYPTSVLEGTTISFTATMTTQSPPSSGTLRIRNLTAGTTLATVAVNGTTTTLSTPSAALAVGDSQIVAEFVGDPSFVQASVSRIQTVTKDSVVDVELQTVTPTTFYPYADGYRDTTKISGTTLEQATVTIRIYNAGGTLIKTFAVGTLQGAYSVTWNGRTPSGSLLPAGTYKIRQTLVDARHNTFTKDVAVSLFWRRVNWITTSVTKYGDSFASYAKAGYGSISKATSSFSRGVKLSGGSIRGYAVARWSFTLNSALAYKGLKISVLGKGTRSTSHGILAFGQDDFGSRVGPGYAWWVRSGTVPGHVNSRVVLLDVEADGPMSGGFDVAKTRVTYTYAVWR